MRNRVFGPERLSNNAVDAVEFQHSENLAGILLALLQDMAVRREGIVISPSASIIQMSRTS